VLASLIVAYTVIPFLASRMLEAGDAAGGGSGHGEGGRALRALTGAISRYYVPALQRALARPRRTLLLATVFVAAALALVPVIGFSLFPAADIPQFRITVETPDGASVADTDRALRFVEAELVRQPEVKHWFANLGRGNPRIYYNIFPEETSANVAEVAAELHRFDPRRSPKLYDELRATFAQYPGARITVESYLNGPPIDAPIEIAISGPDLGQLRELADRAEDIIAATPGTRDVDNPVRRLRTDLDLGIDPQKAALFGIAPVEIDRTVRAAIAGLGAGKFREADGDEFDIMVRLPMSGRPTLDMLDRVEVAAPGGKPVPLRQLATPEFSAAANLIRRHDREREVLITAHPQSGHNTGKVTQAVLARLEALELPTDYRLRIGGEVEAREESFGGIGTAVLVAVFGILAVLVLEFGSFRSMLIVAGVIPLGVAGGLIGLLVTGFTLSFTATIGLVALIGIQIKNSILLVDFSNQLREQGVALEEAIARAGEIRFLPILLTSATAIGGLMPLAVQGSGLYSPLAIVIIGGLISSTLLGGIVTPVMYRLLPPRIEPNAAAPRDAALG
jgi:multidrug efflux pump subunit AcrB